MKISEMYPSRYMKAEDFDEGEVRVLTIRNVEMETLGQGKDQQEKPVITFREQDAKPLVLNKTNTNLIAKFLGLDDSDDWIGHKIALHVLEVEMKGEPVMAIRVKLRMPGASRPAAPIVPEDGPELFEDGAPQIDVGNLGPGVKVPSKQRQPA